MAQMTTTQADKAIKSGKPVTVQTVHGKKFIITITSRDKRTVSGDYEYEGKVYDGKFYRDDLQIIAA